MNKLNKKQLKCYLILALFLTSLGSFAQKNGYLQINGKIRKDNKPEQGVSIQIAASGAQSQTVASKDNGGFTFNLDLQKSYTIKFIKAGLVTKVVEFNTTVPGDQLDIIYQKEFNIDLFPDIVGVSQDKAMSKAVAKFSYNATYEDFEYDQNYSKQILGEQEAVRKVAEDVNKQQERARLDSLNKAWNDSLVKAKAREAELLAKRSEQDKTNAEREKAKQDSIVRANASAQAAAISAAREKNRQDSLNLANSKAQSLAEAQEKERQDALAKAKLDEARQKELAAAADKRRQDSISQAGVDKARADAIAKDKAAADAKIKAAADALAAEKARVDAISKAEVAARQRQKAISDSTEKANIDAKRTEELARIKLKADKDAKALAENKASERSKFVADSTSRAQALKDKQQKDALAAKAESDKLRAENELKAREKQKQDSIQKQRDLQLAEAKAKVEAATKIKEDEEKRKAEIAKEKARKDSSNAAALAQQKADADAKLKAAADAKASADAEKQRLAAKTKAHQDSIYLANAAAREKEDADRQSKAYAEIEAKKKMLGKSSAVTEDKQVTPKTVAPIPKIIDSDYKEGITEETIKETNRTIYRTVVKKDGAANNYQKVAYNWGGVFYFKNDNVMTELSFKQEINNFKKEIK